MKTWEKELLKCIRCGNCMSKCPVYSVELKESSVARGKNLLAKSYLKGKLKEDSSFLRIVYNCLVCKSCTTVCPSGVEFDRIILGLRARLVEEKGLPFVKKLIFSVLKKPGLLGSGVWLASKLQPFFTAPLKEGFSDFKRAKGVLKFLGDRFDEAFVLPGLSPKDLRARQPKRIVRGKGEAKGKILFFTGCSINYFFPAVGEDVIKVLEKAGFEVVMSERHYCCGMPVMVHGDFSTAKELAKKNLEFFERLQPDWIVTACASCASALKKDWEFLFEEEVELLEKHKFWKTRTFEFSEFLVKVAGFLPEGKKKEKAVRVTYHDPCHLKKSIKVFEEPRQIIKNLSCVEFVEMKEPDLCCGSGGSYHLTHPEVSIAIMERKVKSIKETGAERVVTTCPACMLQLAEGAYRFDAGYQVEHLATLLAELM